MTGPAGGDLHGRPTAAELVDAVAGFLRDQLGPTLDGPLRHQVRIAVNALEMVGRELELGPDQRAAHLERLSALGYTDDDGLADAIASGTCADSVGLRRALTADTRSRLEVANPRWLPEPGEGTGRSL